MSNGQTQHLSVRKSMTFASKYYFLKMININVIIFNNSQKEWTVIDR